MNWGGWLAVERSEPPEFDVWGLSIVVPSRFTDFVALRGEAKKMVSQRFGKFGNKSFLETAER
jgi:hypothetical protein